jgi:hypothetical protein
VSDWHELVIEGSEKTVRAFVLGFVAGRGGTERVVFGDDVELHEESRAARLWELLRAGSHSAVFVPETIAQPLAQAIDRHAAETGLRVHEHQVVDAAWFEFRIEIFARDIAQETRAALNALRAHGVTIEDLSENEENHPEAAGVELYAPLHRYAYRASGRISGSISGVLRAWHEMRGRDFVEVGPLHVRAKPVRV